MRILLADDNPAFQQAAERFLKTDHRIRAVDLARTGPEAIDLAERAGYDLLLLDLTLPQVSGLWASLRISSGADAPEVWILSPDDNPEYERAARASGAEGCISRMDFAEKIGPILHRLHGRKAGAGGPGKFPGDPRPGPTREGYRQEVPESRGGMPEEGSPGGRLFQGGKGPMKGLSAIESLEEQCRQVLAGLAKIREDLSAQTQDPDLWNGSPAEDRFLLCRIGGDEVGLPVSRVVQVSDASRMTAMPREYAPVTGVLSQNGRAVPVVDLRKVWKVPLLRERKPGRLITLRSGPRVVALTVDDIVEVIAVPGSSIWPFPFHQASSSRAYLDRLLRFKERFIFLVDVDTIMSDLSA